MCSTNELILVWKIISNQKGQERAFSKKQQLKNTKKTTTRQSVIFFQLYQKIFIFFQDEEKKKERMKRVTEDFWTKCALVCQANHRQHAVQTHPSSICAIHTPPWQFFHTAPSTTMPNAQNVVNWTVMPGSRSNAPSPKQGLNTSTRNSEICVGHHGYILHIMQGLFCISAVLLPFVLSQPLIFY